MDADRYFSNTYAEARERFVREAGRCFAVTGVRHRSGQVCQDLVSIGSPQAAKRLIVLAGVHGVEGYAASAVQLSLILEPLRAPADLQIILIHGINRYGMESFRRVNQNNVDLNRNARATFGQPPDHPAIHYICSIFRRYEEGAPHLLLPKLLLGLSRYGYKNFGSAIAGGQTTSASSVFYAGTRVEPEVELLVELLHATIQAGQHIRVLDLHSGIGSHPHLQFHGSDARLSAARKIHGSSLKRSHGSEIFAVRGSILDSVSTHFPEKDLDLFTFESGTLNSYRLLLALQKENYYHHREPGSKKDVTAKRELFEAFNPHDSQWREQYLAAARSACERCLASMS